MPTDLENQKAATDDVFTCGICYCDYDLKTDQVKFLEECNHTFCAECFQEFFRSMIEDQNKHHQLKCPEYSCETRPTAEDVNSIINGNCFEKYKRFQLNHRVQMDPDLLFCCTPNCGEVHNRKDAVKNKVTCPKCKKMTCILCKLPAHGRKSCQQAEKDMYSNWTGGIEIHKCPQCACQVQKDGGCPHMHCSICTHSWCWSCGLQDDNWWHNLTDDILCGVFNSYFQLKIPFFVKVILALLAIPLSPLLAFGFVLVYIPTYLYEEKLDYLDNGRLCSKLL